MVHIQLETIQNTLVKNIKAYNDAIYVLRIIYQEHTIKVIKCNVIEFLKSDGSIMYQS
jgi:hypothetical protein